MVDVVGYHDDGQRAPASAPSKCTALGDGQAATAECIQ